MKFIVTFKDADALGRAFDAALEMGYSGDEEVIVNLQRQAGKWFKYGEYVDVEIDTDTGTATVVPW